MGSSCSTGQSHKDKDSVSSKSEEVKSRPCSFLWGFWKSSRTSRKGANSSPSGGQPDQQTDPAKGSESPPYQVIVKKASDAATGTEAGNNKQDSKALTIDGGSSSTTSQAPANQGCARQLTASVSDTISNPSPPTMSPRERTEPLLPEEILHLSETFQALITGKISNQTLSCKTRKIVLYVCAADSQDCCVEKGVLHQLVVPELRAYCRDKGYELHITDLHWRTGLEKQQDHEFPELCLGELTRQMEVAYVIPVLFLSNSLGTPLLPKTVETQDFEMALSKAEDKDSLLKWYKLDDDSQPPCYRLLPVASHIPSFKENSWEQQEQALEEWRTEIERTLSAMITAFSEELRNTYLTTVVEQEVHNTILMSQELARRCLWLYRVYTQRPEANNNSSLVEKEQKRRLDILYKDLRSQLTEKHVLRLSVKWNAGGIDNSIPEHAQYINDVMSHLMKHLKAIMFNIIEEDQTKAVVRSQYGVESMFLNELKWQSIFCQKTAQSSVNRENILQHIQGYLTGDSLHPLLVHGPPGSGKTTVLARAIHCVLSWLPDAYLVYRFSLISNLSFSLLTILKTICDHLALLTPPHRLNCPHTLQAYEETLVELLHSISIRRPIVVIIDGLDHVEISNLHWLPDKLPNNAKIILSSTTDSKMVQLFREKVAGEASLLELTELSRTEAEALLITSVSQYSHSVSSSASECFKAAVQNCTLPLYVKVLAWRRSWNPSIEPGGSLSAEFNTLLDWLDQLLERNRLQITLSILTMAKYGLWDSELQDILSHETAFHSDTTYLKWAPVCIHISQLTKYLHPFLHWVSDGSNLTLRISDSTLQSIVTQRYVQQNQMYNKLIKDYFKGEWKEPTTSDSREKSKEKSCKKRKLIEVPRQRALLGENIDDTLLDPAWLFDKICECNVFEILDDIELAMKTTRRPDDLLTLQGILQRRHVGLNHDGRQWYSQLYEEMKGTDAKAVDSWMSSIENPPRLSLIPAPRGTLLAGDHSQGDVNAILRLPDNPDYVVTLSTAHEELCVWNISTCERVRTLTAVNQPLSIQMIDNVRAVVLCGRELRIFDLNKGLLLNKLKGLMHQKMAYFGLHDPHHLVALSRNRMYVNLMNLESGDCIATFKAGEDRFLNSLLVSGDGRILVCGDETQKPFPLLVWSLTSRKLLYDLRIPHHEFLTYLSAITHEGHYVCCVAKEVDEPGCNFIVVYDLQSGTLFKKWKPGVDTTSLDISSKDSCVISGMADARILVWDLVTGNCRWSLRGHSAPVTQVRRDPSGGRFLSADLLNRDRSIRLWCLNKGELLAVYSPSKAFTACELGIGGQTVILALEGDPQITSLELRGPGIDPRPLPAEYGDPSHKGKKFEACETADTR